MSLGDVGDDRDLHRRRHPRGDLPFGRGRDHLRRRGRQLDGRRVDVHPGRVPRGHRRLRPDRSRRRAGWPRRLLAVLLLLRRHAGRVQQLRLDDRRDGPGHPDLLRLDRRRLRDRDGHEHGLATRRRASPRSLLAANPSLTPADVESLLKSSGECPNGAVRRRRRQRRLRRQGPVGQRSRRDRRAARQRPPRGRGRRTGRPATRRPHHVPGRRRDRLRVGGRDRDRDRRPRRHEGRRSSSTARSPRPTRTARRLVDDLGHEPRSPVAPTPSRRRRPTRPARPSRRSVTVWTGVNVQGDWVGDYGADGYVLGNWTGTADLASLPAGVTFSARAGRALQLGLADDRRPRAREPDRDRAAGPDLVRRERGPAPAELHQRLQRHAPPLCPRLGRRTARAARTSASTTGSGPRTVRLAANSFVAGAWIHFPITVGAGGSVVVTVDRTAGGNAVLSGLFLGGRDTPPPPPTVPGAPTGLDRHPRRRPGRPGLDGPGLDRRQPDHRLHRDRQPRWRDVHDGDPRLHDRRPERTGPRTASR